MSNIVHQLIDKESDKLLNIKLNDKTSLSETRNLRKLQTTERMFSIKEEALNNFCRKE